MHKERPYSLVDAAKFGLYGGIAAIMIALVGMVDAFERKDIIADVVTMSQVLLGAMAFTPAFLAASRAQQSRGKGFSLVAGGVAGAIAALLVALLALAIVPLNLRAVFVNATPVLVGELMPGDLEGITGAIVLVAAGLVVGLAAALLTWLPARLRRSTIISLVAVTLIALLADVIAVIIPREVDRYIYRSNGLSVEGAITLFVVILVIAYLWQVLQPKLNRAVANLPESRRQVLRFVTTIVLLALLFALPALLGSYLSEVADLVGFYIVMALGLNVVVGFAGLLDLGLRGVLRHRRLHDGGADHAGTAVGAQLPPPVELLGGAAAGGAGCAAGRRLPRRAGAQNPRRLPGDHHAGLRRDHPPAGALGRVEAGHGRRAGRHRHRPPGGLRPPRPTRRRSSTT
jgi:hypothetical protein